MVNFSRCTLIPESVPEKQKRVCLEYFVHVPGTDLNLCIMLEHSFFNDLAFFCVGI